MNDLYMIVTNSGVRVHDNAGQGFTEAEVDTSVADRNTRAEALGISTRYEKAAGTYDPKTKKFTST